MLSSPAAGSTLLASGQTFNWTPISGATGYSLWLGSTGVGSNNLFDMHTTADTIKTGNLPTNGETIYARLFTNINGSWEYNDYTFIAK
jgi:hypothetical protein